MQFIENGPDIPESLLRLHEEGRVVFFCGAGISYPAGLPGFGGLVDRLYKNLQVDPSPVAQAAINAKRYDTAIGLLEQEIVGHRETVRNTLASILNPDLQSPNATTTHESLLTLSKNKTEQIRLITTNFDRIFEKLTSESSIPTKKYLAPFLPIPKNRWNGIVYLHGLIPQEPTPEELDRLIITSGDFGLAYLTERWAARFISELFRSYTVCFIGYSIDDPILRYMMDALAADQLLGETNPEMFAFGSFTENKYEEAQNEWKAKNVTPILYQESTTHHLLHNTIKEWAKTYRDGALGKERIVAENSIAPPSKSTLQDDFVGRLIWAISDSSGGPAKLFADLEPPPSLDWLPSFYQNRYKHNDLCRFDVTATQAIDKHLEFSLIFRPSPYTRSPWMTLTRDLNHEPKWDNVMRHIARWLSKHLDNPDLIIWLAERGGNLTNQFSGIIEQALSETDKIERSGSPEDLAEYKKRFPHAIPRPTMRTLWRILLSGQVGYRSNRGHLYDWIRRAEEEEFSQSLRIQLRSLLAPMVFLRRPDNLILLSNNTPDGSIKDLVDWEVEISTPNAESILRDGINKSKLIPLFSRLLPDLASLLEDIFGLKQELGGADDLFDESHYRLPSITPHEQNQFASNWSVLVTLLRDGWLHLLEKDPLQAHHVAISWKNIKYPIFKRLALFAAAQPGSISPELSLRWLLEDQAWWLWSPTTKRESIRLLLAIFPILSESDRVALEQILIAGPPRSMFREELEPEHWIEAKERQSWLRLAKLESLQVTFDRFTSEWFEELKARRPKWRLADDDRDEFSIWMMPDNDDQLGSPNARAPRKVRELVSWLQDNPKINEWEDDGWHSRCRTNYAASALALIILSERGIWPADRWVTALNAWSFTKSIKSSWRRIAPVISKAPEYFITKAARGIGFWIRESAAKMHCHEDHFFTLCSILLTIDYPPLKNEDLADPVFAAINHPIGHTTEALLQYWYRSPLYDNQGIPEKFKTFFEQIANTSIDKLIYGRVIIFSNLINIFRIDHSWTTTNILPLLDWSRQPQEAIYHWKGFLGSARLYQPLIESIKTPFLEAAGKYQVLDRYAEQYAALIVLIGLSGNSVLSIAELRSVMAELPAEGLEDAARSLLRFTESSSAQSLDHWVNRASPFLDSAWPKDQGKVTPQIASTMASLCVSAKDAFDQAFNTLKHWLRAEEINYILLRQIKDKAICENFPSEALDFLFITVTREGPRYTRDLEDCLNAIRTAKPELATSTKFQRLSEFARG